MNAAFARLRTEVAGDIAALNRQFERMEAG